MPSGAAEPAHRQWRGRARGEGGLLSPLIQARVDFQEAARHGLGVTEFNASGQAAADMRTLWASLKRRLGLGRGKAKTPIGKAA